MDHTFVGVARQRRMMMELDISSQDVIRHKEVCVSHLLYGLGKRTYCPRICTDLRLGKNSSYLHDASPLMAFYYYHTLWQEISVAAWLTRTNGSGNSSNGPLCHMSRGHACSTM